MTLSRRDVLKGASAAAAVAAVAPLLPAAVEPSLTFSPLTTVKGVYIWDGNPAGTFGKYIGLVEKTIRLGDELVIDLGPSGTLKLT